MRKKASQKLYALASIALFMHLKQKRNIMKASVEFQFGYSNMDVPQQRT